MDTDWDMLRKMQGVPRRVLAVILGAESGNRPSKRLSPTSAKDVIDTQVMPRIPADAGGRVRTDPSPSPIITRAISIIAEESGLAEADLVDGTVFGDVGIDSLLGLTISARFKEDLDLDLDFNSLFYEYPTIGDLKAFLGGESKETSSSASPSSESIYSDDTQATTLSASEKLLAISDVQFRRAVEIISEESGVAMEDLSDDSNFADCGVDSLLSLVIVSRFRDELELDIQHESLILDCPTVADLKQMLGGQSEVETQPQEKSVKTAPKVDAALVVDEPTNSIPADTEAAALAARKKAIDSYVEKYVAGFSVPEPCTSEGGAVAYDEQAKVVLVTGATGSLGGHLAFQLAHRADVQTVVCLNREHRTEAAARQKKAMKDKGVHFPDHLLPKLRVLQADTSRPRLGLPRAEYDGLAASVTHIIHQAWPMSVKRPLAGFEPQFAAMRHLADLAGAVAGRRPADFRVGFQLVSSISVVGNYRGHGGRVPEAAVGVEALLPVGYAEAKWGCERMLEATLRRHPARARAMTVRLGQIAGSRASGYWNPLEHFGFLVRSAQTLRALPDVGGTARWTPVDVVAGALADLGLAGPRVPCYPVYHVENPAGQPWRALTAVLADALAIPREGLVALPEWTRRVRAAPTRNNPASALVDFLDANYERMSCGGLVLDAKHAVEHSPTLAAAGPVSEDVVRKYIHVWKEIGFLD